MSRALVILGGCGGIGRELAHQAEAAGYQLILLDLAASIERHQPEQPAFAVDAATRPACGPRWPICRMP